MTSHRRHVRSGGAPRSNERGETLIELMATSILMGIAIVAILTGLLNAIRSSDMHRRYVRAGNEAVVLGEAVIAAPYQRCTATPAPATEYAKVFDVGGTVAEPNGYTYEIVSVTYLQDKTAGTPTFGATCPSTDQGAQRVEVRVTTNGPQTVRERLVVVKRDPA